MANEYYERLSEMNPGDLADGLAMEAEFDAIAQGFSKLPTPHTGGQGFDGPVRVGDAVNDDEAVSLGQLNAAIGEAVLLPIATYGNLSAAAWETLPSNTYLLFGTGAQFSNTPYTLVAGSTYYLQVRHVIGGDGVSIYHDQLSLASTDDASNVDLRRLFVRTGATFAGAVSGDWVGFTLKKAALTALESLIPAADRLAYYTGTGAASLATLTAFARSLLDDADADAALATLGAIGLQSTIITTQDWNSITTQGIYRASLFTGLNGPATYTYGLLVVINNGTVFEQTYYPHSTASGVIRSAIARRQSYNGGSSWNPWEYMHSNRTVLGTVAQSSGVPTGAIIERGSNANGEYVKFADGTMLITRAYTMAASSNDNSGTQIDYPAAFSSVQFVSANVKVAASASLGGSYVVEAFSVSLSAFKIKVLAHGSTTITNPSGPTNVTCFAIGRWF